MDPARIGLAHPECKSGALPLCYGPVVGRNNFLGKLNVPTTFKFVEQIYYVVGTDGVEPSTSSLSVTRSTGELRALQNHPDPRLKKPWVSYVAAAPIFPPRGDFQNFQRKFSLLYHKQKHALSKGLSSLIFESCSYLILRNPRRIGADIYRLSTNTTH